MPKDFVHIVTYRVIAGSGSIPRDLYDRLEKWGHVKEDGMLSPEGVALVSEYLDREAAWPGLDADQEVTEELAVSVFPEADDGTVPEVDG